jgi:epsilon-lactone hydrolase
MTGARMRYDVTPVRIGIRSRLLMQQSRLFLKPLGHWMWSGGPGRLMWLQARFAGVARSSSGGLDLQQRRLGGVPAKVFGHFDDHGQTLLLYLHGGGFCLPAVPRFHYGFAARLCRDLGAVGVMPEYRLSPQHRFPSALDDCEHVYRAVLDAGFDARRVVLVGESAGGNLVLGLLQRIRRHGLPQPGCAVPISAGTDLTGVDALASRRRNASRDPMLPRRSLERAIEFYVGELDSAHPEISPARADFVGFPPLYFLVAENEVLLDDTLVCAERARQAGVETRLDVWPVLPHAFPLLGKFIPEARLARREIVEFARSRLGA